jgi:hybrid cluster-associated redox disulfide protein
MQAAESESITANTTIDELVRRYPSSARVFTRRHMHCVGCEIDRFHTVADACRIYGLRLTPVLSELRQAACASKRPTAA